MTSIQTYQGIVHKGRIQLTQSAILPEGSQVYVFVADEGQRVPLLDPHIARRKANGWLVTHVGSVMAQQPQLQQVEGQLIWRFKAYLTMRGQLPRGPVGDVAVDAYNGEVLNSKETATEMITNAAAIARTLSSTDS